MIVELAADRVSLALTGKKIAHRMMSATMMRRYCYKNVIDVMGRSLSSITFKINCHFGIGN